MDEPLLDMTSLIEDVGEEEAALAILGAYLEEVETRIPRLREAIASGDLPLAVRQAHSIKGGALNFSAHSLARPALELETMARSGELLDTEALVAAIEKGFAALKDYHSSRVGG